jgi:hypothetical protein
VPVLQPAMVRAVTRRLLDAALLLLAAAICAAQGAPVVRETQPRKPVKGDPALNSASANPHPGLPARALAQGARAEREPEKAHWAVARWTRATLQPPGTAQKTVTVPASGTVLVRASWPGPSAVDLTIQKQGATLATAAASKRYDGVMVATAQAKVPSAGEVVIRAAGPGSQSVKVDLYVGVLPAGR